jgi:integrase
MAPATFAASGDRGPRERNPPMSKAKPKRRRRVERNIYLRTDSTGRETYEIGWRGSDGKQHFRSVGPKITVARRELAAELARRGEGKSQPADPRLTFGKAATAMLDNGLKDVRKTTRDSYRWAIEKHLRPRFATRRLDRVQPDDWSQFVADLRANDYSEATIETILKAARQVYGYAQRSMHWRGTNTLSMLRRGEKPRTGEAAERRRLFSEAELNATLKAASGQHRLAFAFAATVGSRISETLGLIWSDLDLSNLDAASVSFAAQVDEAGERVPLKTPESRRTVELPRSLATMLAAHRIESLHSADDDFVFATRSGAALNRHNVARELRRAMKLATIDGKPAFPILSEVDAEEKPVPVPRGSVPSFHSFRHVVASRVIEEDGSAEEASWLLGHRDSTVTRRVYVSEIKSVERTAKRRAKMEARMGGVLSALETEAESPGKRRAKPHGAKVVDLRP